VMSNIKEIYWTLLPIPAILKILYVAHHQRTRKWLACRKHNSSVLLAHTPVLLPQWLKRYHTIPLASRSPIRQVSHHHVNVTVWNLPHALQAVSQHQRYPTRALSHSPSYPQTINPSSPFGKKLSGRLINRDFSPRQKFQPPPPYCTQLALARDLQFNHPFE
jgi:hypothetical protein